MKHCLTHWLIVVLSAFTATVSAQEATFILEGDLSALYASGNFVVWSPKPEPESGGAAVTMAAASTATSASTSTAAATFRIDRRRNLRLGRRLDEFEGIDAGRDRQSAAQSRRHVSGGGGRGYAARSVLLRSGTPSGTKDGAWERSRATRSYSSPETCDCT